MVRMHTARAHMLVRGKIHRKRCERCADCLQYVTACVCDVLTDNQPRELGATEQQWF